MANNNLSKARKSPNDEFYTLLDDVFREVVMYKNQLKDKIVYCNCDDSSSAFLYFFMTYFHLLELKKLYCTGIAGWCIEYDGLRKKKYRVNGDFRSSDCLEILEKCNIVITNPPFSLFIEFIQLISGKDFLVIGKKNAVSYHVLFPLILCSRVKTGYTTPNLFYRPDGSISDNLKGKCRWFTTLPVSGKPVLTPTCEFNGQYLEYDLYPAIEVGRVKKIPANYPGLMGVPITFIDKIDYDNYKIVDMISRYAVMDKSFDVKGHQLTETNGKPKYSRLIIQKQ